LKNPRGGINGLNMRAGSYRC